MRVRDELYSVLALSHASHVQDLLYPGAACNYEILSRALIASPATGAFLEPW